MDAKASAPLKSFEELGSAMQGEKKFNRNPINTVEPVSLRRLVEIIGNQTKVGDMIGVSGSHISSCLTNNEARLSYELAAKAVLMEMEREPSRPTFYLVEVRNGQREVFDAFLKGMSMKATTI
jgi:hypothetical protein